MNIERKAESGRGSAARVKVEIKNVKRSRRACGAGEWRAVEASGGVLRTLTLSTPNDLISFYTVPTEY